MQVAANCCVVPATIEGDPGATVMVVRTALHVRVELGAVSPSFVALMALVPPPLEVQLTWRVAVNAPMVAIEGVPLVKTAVAVTFCVEASE